MSLSNGVRAKGGRIVGKKPETAWDKFGPSAAITVVVGWVGGRCPATVSDGSFGTIVAFVFCLKGTLGALPHVLRRRRRLGGRMATRAGPLRPDRSCGRGMSEP